MPPLFSGVLDQLVSTTPLIGYVGPGAGLTMLGALAAVMGMLLLAVLAPLLYPLLAMRAWLLQRHGTLERQSIVAQSVADGRSGPGMAEPVSPASKETCPP